jgi:hypothetical protein
MTTGDDFRSALREALSEGKPIDVLLEHPRVLAQLKRICQRIAGKAYDEDFLLEVFARVRDSATRIDPDQIQSVGGFFRWLTLLARGVYVSKRRLSFAAKSCLDLSGKWPDSVEAIDFDELDAFYEHAEVCLYHREMLQAEEMAAEQELLSVFRAARGFHSQGEILRGAKLQAAVTEHQRRWSIWSKSKPQKGFPFSYISLRNGDKEIACCGKFFHFHKHESVNQLDLKAGLQIRGIKNNADEDVLLGAYLLEGVSHDGHEQTLELDNGYTVGLSIAPSVEELRRPAKRRPASAVGSFVVQFRCVESKAMEEERIRVAAGENKEPKAMAQGAGSRVSLIRRATAKVTLSGLGSLAAGWQLLTSSWQTVALSAALLLIFAASAGGLLAPVVREIAAAKTSPGSSITPNAPQVKDSTACPGAGNAAHSQAGSSDTGHDPKPGAERQPQVNPATAGNRNPGPSANGASASKDVAKQIQDPPPPLPTPPAKQPTGTARHDVDPRVDEVARHPPPPISSGRIAALFLTPKAETENFQGEGAEARAFAVGNQRYLIGNDDRVIAVYRVAAFSGDKDTWLLETREVMDALFSRSEVRFALRSEPLNPWMVTVKWHVRDTPEKNDNLINIVVSVCQTGSSCQQLYLSTEKDCERERCAKPLSEMIDKVYGDLRSQSSAVEYGPLDNNQKSHWEMESGAASDGH